MGNVLDFSGFCGQRHVSMLETGARSPLQKTRKLAMRWCVGEKINKPKYLTLFC
jgi:hypothetical protein